MLALNIGLSLTSALVCTALLSGIQGAFTDIRTLSGGVRFDDFRCSWQRSRVSQRQEPKVLPSKHWSWHDWKKADKNGKKDLACNPTYFQAWCWQPLNRFLLMQRCVIQEVLDDRLNFPCSMTACHRRFRNALCWMLLSLTGNFGFKELQILVRFAGRVSSWTWWQAVIICCTVIRVVVVMYKCW